MAIKIVYSKNLKWEIKLCCTTQLKQTMLFWKEMVCHSLNVSIKVQMVKWIAQKNDVCINHQD